MASIGKFWTALFFGVALWASRGQAQTLPQTSVDALQMMTAQAGVIFTGQVVAVRQHAAVVEIDFAVLDSIRGVSGGSYTLREWAGLWPGGDEPFRVGQQYLMLLHTSGAGELSSPVNGMDGAIPIRGGAAGIGRVVDLSWVGTKVVTPTVYLPAPIRQSVARPIMVQSQANAVDAVVPIEKVSASAQQSTAYAAVVTMLRSWETQEHGR
jgi:hypothetical protein